MKVAQDVEKAYKAALLARSRAHAPYSHFRVGSALKVREHTDVFVGCNVENASYGATMCAERSALFSAVSCLGQVHGEFLVVVTGEVQATAPCGLCLQAFAEFCPDDMPVYLGNTQALIKVQIFKDFLPYAFRAFRGSK